MTELNMTPLIDVMLVLIIMFIITIPIQNHSINLNLPTGATVDYVTGVTDLASCLAAPPGPNRLLAQVLVQLQTLLDVYAVAGFGALRGAWLQRNAFADLPVRIVGEALELAGTCAGVDEDGALLLLTSAGMQRVLSGEVSLRLA